MNRFINVEYFFNSILLVNGELYLERSLLILECLVFVSCYYCVFGFLGILVFYVDVLEVYFLGGKVKVFYLRRFNLYLVK